MTAIRLLLLGDTHVGLEPSHIRNFERALEAAFAGNVDAVVHGGDILYRSKVPPRLVEQAFAPLKRVADAGVPVYVVPGNHERSHIPYPILAMHPGVHIFHGPTTFTAELRGLRVAFAGFPYAQRVRESFADIVESTRYRGAAADINLICMHHCFEGATCGPADYTFRYNPDVVRADDVPHDVAAIVTGHIHRHQVITRDLRGRHLPAPVLYAGSVARTSWVENPETKGYMIIELTADTTGGRVADWQFVPLPARQLIRRARARTYSW
jgi:DNA repair exonuclease SbcCD nuclease subunit